MARRPGSGDDQQIGRGHRCSRLEMMLEEPDLIDADAFGELDLFELRRNITSCVEFSRGVVVDQIASLAGSSSGGGQATACRDVGRPAPLLSAGSAHS